MIVSKRGLFKSNSNSSHLLPYSESCHKTVGQGHSPSERLRHPDLWQLSGFIMEMLTWVHVNCEEHVLGELSCVLRWPKQLLLSFPYLALCKKRWHCRCPVPEAFHKEGSHCIHNPCIHTGVKKPAPGRDISPFASDGIKNLPLADCFSLFRTFFSPSFSLLAVVLQTFSLSYNDTICWSCWTVVFPRQARSQLAAGKLSHDLMKTVLPFWTSLKMAQAIHCFHLILDFTPISPLGKSTEQWIGHSHLETSKICSNKKKKQNRRRQKSSQGSGLVCPDHQGPPSGWTLKGLKSPSRNDGAMSRSS